MSANTNLTLNSRYILYHRDGLLDIFIGIYLLTAGTAVATKMTFLSGAWVIIFIPLWISARNAITKRRIPPSSLPHNPAAQAALSISLVGFFVAGIAVGALFLFGTREASGLREFLETYLHLGVGAGVAFLLLTFSAILKTGRLALYALAAAAIFAVAHMVGWPFFISFLALGSLMVACGIALATRFIRQNPLSGA